MASVRGLRVTILFMQQYQVSSPELIPGQLNLKPFTNIAFDILTPLPHALIRSVICNPHVAGVEGVFPN